MNIKTLLVGIFISTSAIANAVTAEEITLKIGYSAGGGYDTFGRLVGRHLGRHLPGQPTIIAQNVPGAGSLKLMRQMMMSEPADGTVIAHVNSSNAAAALIKPDVSNFDPYDIVWIGSLISQPSLCYVSKDAGIETIEDFLTQEFLVGATGKTSQTYVFPAMLKELFDAKFEIVTGFSGGTEIDLAVARGEITGRCGNALVALRSKGMMDSIDVIGQVGITIPEDHAEYVSYIDMIENELDRKAARLVISGLQFDRPFILPAGTPDDIVADFREAFDKMVVDPEFLAEAETLKLISQPTSGSDIDALLLDVLDVDEAVLERARELSE